LLGIICLILNLVTAYKNVVAVDLRWIKILNYEQTAVDLIETYSPDTIIVMLNPNQLYGENNSQFSFGLNSQ